MQSVCCHILGVIFYHEITAEHIDGITFTLELT